MTATLSALFAEYHRSLVRMLYRRTGDADHAEEIAQGAAFQRVRYGGGDAEAVMADCGVDSGE